VPCEWATKLVVGLLVVALSSALINPMYGKARDLLDLLLQLQWLRTEVTDAFI